MIYGNIENINRYVNCYDGFKEGFDFILRAAKKNLPQGHYNIGTFNYANIDTFDSGESKEYEAHKKYIDIQYICKGSDRLYYSDDSEAILIKKYDPDKDIAFYKVNDKNFCNLTKDNFVVFFPEDLHRHKYLPCKESKEVKKIVVKIRINS